MFGPLRNPFVLLTLFMILKSPSSAQSAPNADKLDLAHSRPVSAGESTPAIGFLLRYVEPSGGAKRTKSCLGVRVSPSHILTAASCFAAGRSKVELGTLIAGDGRRAAAEVVEIRQHKSYDIAAIRLDYFPSELDSLVEVATISRQALKVGENLTAYAASGCVNMKPNENCVLRYLKTFTTNLEPSSGDKRLFTIKSGKDELTDGSLGSPVLNHQRAVVGIVTKLKGTNSDLTYVDTNDPEILELFSPLENALPPDYEVLLVENNYGAFMPTGSFPRLKIGEFLASFDLNFQLNGLPVERHKVTKMGPTYTIHEALREGRNILSLIVSSQETGLIFEGELPVYAGSRIIQFSLPEVKNPKEARRKAELIVDPKILARGVGQVEGGILVFKYVPALRTIARVDFPDQVLSYTEFLDEKVTGMTLEDGAMGPLTDNENLDFSKGLDGWTVKGDPKSVRVLTGKELMKEWEKEKEQKKSP